MSSYDSMQAAAAKGEAWHTPIGNDLHVELLLLHDRNTSEVNKHKKSDECHFLKEGWRKGGTRFGHEKRGRCRNCCTTQGKLDVLRIEARKQLLCILPVR